jgi:ribosomal protein S18 acetylase RimI-like enzyme
MRIAACAEDDCTAVTMFWARCGLTRPWNPPEQDFRLAVQGATSAVLAGWLDDRIVASVMVGFDGHRGWIYYLAVDPHLQRRGLGRAMMAAAENWLGGRGAPKLQLMVREGNAEALAFYEHLGLERQSVVTLGRKLS